jgi:hypothetical protein
MIYAINAAIYEIQFSQEINMKTGSTEKLITRTLTLFSREDSGMDVLREYQELPSDSAVMREALKYYEHGLEARLVVRSAVDGQPLDLLAAYNFLPPRTLHRTTCVFHPETISRIDRIKMDPRIGHYTPNPSESEIIRRAVDYVARLQMHGILGSDFFKPGKRQKLVPFEYYAFRPMPSMAPAERESWVKKLSPVLTSRHAPA